MMLRASGGFRYFPEKTSGKIGMTEPGDVIPAGAKRNAAIS